MRRVLTLLFAVVLAGLVASPAAALVPATTIDDVVVVADRPVYNDPKAQNALTAAQADELRSQISTGGSAIFIAVLPGGRPQQQQHRGRCALPAAERR